MTKDFDEQDLRVDGIPRDLMGKDQPVPDRAKYLAQAAANNLLDVLTPQGDLDVVKMRRMVNVVAPIAESIQTLVRIQDTGPDREKIKATTVLLQMQGALPKEGIEINVNPPAPPPSIETLREKMRAFQTTVKGETVDGQRGSGTGTSGLSGERNSPSIPALIPGSVPEDVPGGSDGDPEGEDSTGTPEGTTPRGGGEAAV